MLRSARIAALLAATVALAVPAAALAGTGPVLVGSVADAVNLSTVDAVTVSGHYAYAAAYDAGELTAVDFSNPQSPSIVSGTGAPPLQTNLIAGTNVAIAGGYAFVTSKNRNASTTSNDDGNGNSLTILDIHSDPTHPSIVGTIRDTSKLFGSYGIAVSGNYAFVAYQGLLSGQPTGPDTSKGGFSVIDISNPAGPTIVANIDNAGLAGTKYAGDLYHATTVAISGHYAYVNTFYNHALLVIDISNPTSPKIVANLNDATNLTSVVDFAIQGNYLYAADQAGGTAPQLTVVDISNPLSPKVAATLTNPSLSGAYRIRVSGDFVYESASNNSTIGAIDISDPLHPRLAGFVTDTLHLHSTTGLDVDPTGQYVVAASPYIKIAPYNQSNPVYPPYPDSGSGAPLNTGTISVIQLDPNPIAVTINSTPPSSTTSTSASFTFSTNDDVSAAQCQLDAGPFAPCTTALPSGGASYNGLAVGSHTFTVIATDSAGNTSSQSYSWTVGTAPSGPVPTVAGSAVQGQTLTGTTGTWAGSPTPNLTYQWNDCDATGQNCSAATGPGAQTLSYTLTQNDVGSTLELTVTGTNSVGQSSQTSQPTAVVTASGGSVPTMQSAPSITPASPTVGSQVSASQGSWSGSPNSFSYQWERCDSSGQNCTDIGSASSSNAYTPVAADAGSTLVVAVTASNNVGPSAPASSSPTQAVTEAPVNTVAPTVSGSPVQGQTLTANAGTWTGYPTPTVSGYQWLQCDQNGSNCNPISGATNSTYVAQPGDVGNTLAVEVTETNTVNSTSATSAASSVVAGTSSPPANTGAKPAISGTASVGSQLTASAGGWSGSPAPSFSYQWERCDASGQNCTNIGSSSNSTTYSPVGADAGSTIVVAVTASNTAGQASASSQATAQVTEAPQNTGAPTISGTASQGQTLTANPGNWAVYPAPSFSYSWLRCNSVGASCTAISGATAQTYVLVRADVGRDVEVTVTANNGIAPNGTATSAVVGPVVGPPVNTLAPVISGTATQGQTLTSTGGAWSGYPAPTLRFQWMRCNTLGELCTAITGATQRPYTLGTADVGHTLRTYVFATNIAGTTLARTAPTAVVQASATGSVALHLPRAGAAQLTITVRASKGSAAFTRITLAPPKGTSFNVPNSLLSRLVRVLDGSGHRVSFTLVRKGSGLVITLRKSERSVKLIVGVRVASANLARHHRASWGIRFKETFRGLTQF